MNSGSRATDFQLVTFLHSPQNIFWAKLATGKSGKVAKEFGGSAVRAGSAALFFLL